MKRLLAVAAACLLMTGCGQVEELPEFTEKCSICLEEVDSWLDTSGGDRICARCFSQENWQVCLSCGKAYDPSGFDDADGYCAECADTETWYCSLCEESFGLEHLADLKNGYYLCANCAGLLLREADPDVGGTVEAASPFWPRDQYLEERNEPNLDR